MHRQRQYPPRGPLAVLLLLAAAALLAMLAGLGLEWALRNFVFTPVPAEMPAGARVQHLGSGRATRRALDELAALPPARRATLRRDLAAAISDLDGWIAELRGRRHTIVCLGERHDIPTRRFVAERLLPTLPADVLMLEASSEAASRLERGASNGATASTERLLGAPIGEVIAAARQANPAVEIAGIDESRDQGVLRERRGTGSRDHSIARNLRERFRPGLRHVVLFGAFHCMDRPQWLFARIARDDPRFVPGEMINATMLAWHGDGTVEAFANFLADAGIARPDLVVPDTRRLPAEAFRWFPGLARILGPYRAAVIFDACPECGGKGR